MYIRRLCCKFRPIYKHHKQTYFWTACPDRAQRVTHSLYIRDVCCIAGAVQRKKADGGSLKEIVQMLNPESTAEGEETFLDALGAVVK